MNTILQVPLKKDLRDRAGKAAQDMGFSSLQELVRVYLTQIAQQTMHIKFEEKPVKLSAKNARRYEKMMKDIESGKVKTKSFTSVDELMKDLQS